MSNTKSQILYTSSKQQTLSDSRERPLRGVRQDKGGTASARAASHQAARRHAQARAKPPSTKSPQHTTVKITLWVRPLVKDELARRSSREGISLSAAGAALLERALQQSLDMEYGALLRPIITRAVRDELTSVSGRLTWLLLRNAFDSGQTRALVTNILGRQPGMTPDLLEKILDQSAKTAKGNLARKTPQLTALLEMIETFVFTEGALSHKDNE
jgi:hypothetical protein